MIVETFPFLMAVSLQECGIQIKENVFRRPDPVDFLTQDAEYLLELHQRIFIHTVEKTRYRRLRSKSILARNRTEYRVCGKIISVNVIEATGKDLKDPLHEGFIVSMEPECNRIICLRVITDDFFKTEAVHELLKEKQTSIGIKFAATEDKFELFIETERGVIYYRHWDLSYMFDFDSTP